MSCGLPIAQGWECRECEDDRTAKVYAEYRTELARTWARIRSGEVDAARREERSGRENAWKEAADVPE
jgi:hypothetical protein